MPAIHSHSTEYQASKDEGGLPQVWQGQADRATLGGFSRLSPSNPQVLSSLLFTDKETLYQGTIYL